jgi:hypothetical protein
VRTFPPLAVLALAFAAQGALAQSVALLPSVGGVPESERKAVDGALRKALNAVDGVRLQSAADTKRHVLSMAELGLVCLPDDIPCLAKIGLAADVALVLVPVVEPARSGALDVAIGVIDVAKTTSVRTARADVDLEEADARDNLEALVDKALGRTGKPDVDPEPNPDPKPHPDPDPTPPVVEEAGSPMATAGFAIAGIGGAVLGVGLLGATFCELAYAGIIGGFDAKTRADAIRPAGIGLWITGAIGAVALGSGLVLALVAGAPEDE